MTFNFEVFNGQNSLTSLKKAKKGILDQKVIYYGFETEMIC